MARPSYRKRYVDWPRILVRHGTEFIVSGENVKKGEVNVKCPFCRNDPSYHMGLHPAGLWACWRNKSHSGSNPSKLLHHLLGIPFQEAKELTTGEPELLPMSELRERFNSLDKPRESASLLMPLRHPKSHRRIKEGDRFWRYLASRKFYEDDLSTLAYNYQLRGAMTGEQAYRVIFPIYIDGSLVGWTGRAITKSKAKYKTHPSGDEAIASRVIYNQSGAMRGGKVLLIVEGPLDALKLDFYGWRLGVRAVALLGLKSSVSKDVLLQDVADRFERVYLLLDPGAQRAAHEGRGGFSYLGVSLLPKRLLRGKEDPGALSPRGALRFCREVLRTSA